MSKEKLNLKENAKELGISITYLWEILRGRKGCNEELMLKMIKKYPELDFTLLNPRYILRKDNKCNYIEQEYFGLLELYNIHIQDLEELQARIDKAIEYIEQVNKDKDQVPYLTEGETLKLLDILRGEDNE